MKYIEGIMLIVLLYSGFLTQRIYFFMFGSIARIWTINQIKSVCVLKQNIDGFVQGSYCRAIAMLDAMPESVSSLKFAEVERTISF